MAHDSYSKLRDNLATCMDEVCNGRAPLVITRRNAQRRPDVGGGL
jgi:antitoxin YefM